MSSRLQTAPQAHGTVRVPWKAQLAQNGWPQGLGPAGGHGDYACLLSHHVNADWVRAVPPVDADGTPTAPHVHADWTHGGSLAACWAGWLRRRRCCAVQRSMQGAPGQLDLQSRCRHSTSAGHHVSVESYACF